MPVGWTKFGIGYIRHKLVIVTSSISITAQARFIKMFVFCALSLSRTSKFI